MKRGSAEAVKRSQDENVGHGSRGAETRKRASAEAVKCSQHGNAETWMQRMICELLSIGSSYYVNRIRLLCQILLEIQQHDASFQLRDS